MPTTMIKETTVYTLEELDAQFSYGVYENAIDNILRYAWEGWEPSWYTEDMATVIETDFPLFRPQQRSWRNTSGKTGYSPEIEWSTNPNWVKCSGSVNVACFMREKKLRNKYRLLWEGIKAYASNVVLDVPVGFGHGSSGECDLSDLVDDIGFNYPCKRDYWHKADPRFERLKAQAKELEDEIDSYVDEIESHLLRNLRAEMDYLCSEEFAKEEAASNEFVFTASGNIYHG